MNRLAAYDHFETHPPRALWNAGDHPPHSETAAPHRLEGAVRRHLLSHPKLRFSTLVIRRIPNGVCLQGVLEDSVDLDVCNLARSVAGVNEVLNHLVVRQRQS
jgi:hypothetical protein